MGDGDVAVDVQVLDQRLTMKYHLSKVRLREFVWVGGHINVGWASGPGVLVSRGQGPSMSWDLWPRPVVRAVARGRRSVHRSAKTAPRDRFGTLVYTVATRRSRERTVGTGVYTDRRKRPRGAVLGHLCTLLRREGHASGCEGAQECTQIGKNGPSGPFWDMRIIPTNESMRSTFRKTPLDVG